METTMSAPQPTSSADNVLLKMGDAYYDFYWMKAMLQKARACRTPGSTLIVGNSYGVYDVLTRFWSNAINCSSASQDLYYSFLCVKKACGSVSSKFFSRCFILGGYYMFGHDLSLSETECESRISSLFYPLFHDAHHWQTPYAMNHREDVLKQVPSEIREKVQKLFVQFEKDAIQEFTETGSYFLPAKLRDTAVAIDDVKNPWAQAAAEERMRWSEFRTFAHNRLFSHKASLEENREILNNLVQYLCEHQVEPIIVIAPFSEEYNRLILPEMKADLTARLKTLPKSARILDLNEMSCFDSGDFLDPDHMSEAGAEKVSRILVETFGH